MQKEINEMILRSDVDKDFLIQYCIKNIDNKFIKDFYKLEVNAIANNIYGLDVDIDQLIYLCTIVTYLDHIETVRKKDYSPSTEDYKLTQNNTILLLFTDIPTSSKVVKEVYTYDKVKGKLNFVIKRLLFLINEKVNYNFISYKLDIKLKDNLFKMFSLFNTDLTFWYKWIESLFDYVSFLFLEMNDIDLLPEFYFDLCDFMRSSNTRHNIVINNDIKTLYETMRTMLDSYLTHLDSQLLYKHINDNDFVVYKLFSKLLLKNSYEDIMSKFYSVIDCINKHKKDEENKNG